MFFSTHLVFDGKVDGRSYRLVSLEQYHATSFVSGSEVVSCMIELDCRNDIRCACKHLDKHQ
jgi:hypothetical protein